MTGRLRAENIGDVDPFRYTDSIVVQAPAEAIYDLVTDIARTGEWSPICRECWWRDSTGAEPGAWFVGHNEADGQEWETQSQVVVVERGREFAWLVGGQYARWSYRFERLGQARTRLTESWEFLPAGRAMFREKYGADAQQRMQLRRRQAVAGIPATLAAIKRIAEAGLAEAAPEPSPHPSEGTTSD